MSLLYSLVLGNRVIFQSVSVVLGLGTLIDTPYLAGFVVAFSGKLQSSRVSIIHVPSGGSSRVKHSLRCLFYLVTPLRTIST